MHMMVILIRCECAGLPLRKHQPTVERMQESYEKRGIDLNEARLRMATLPEPATQVCALSCLYPALLYVLVIPID